jgi:UDP-N-acetylmuramoylalanine--D-glutamate ligase
MKTEINKLRTPIAIVGMAKSGESALNFLLKSGISRQQIITFDEKTSADVQNHDELLKRQPKTCVVSPGFPLNSALIKNLKNQGCHLTSELNLANAVITSEKIIGITGSLGKSTTVSLLGEAIKHDDPWAFVGGNLGIPFCEYALKILNGERRSQWIVLELSSYQLENCHELEFICTGLTYLSANHLERYDSLESYYSAKMNLFRQSKGKNFVNSNGGDSLTYLCNLKMSFQATDADLFKIENYPYQKARLIGKHNTDNLLLALTIACDLGLSKEAKEKMLNYPGLSHRLEFVGEFNNIRFINDSKATAIDSVMTAVNATVEISDRVYLLVGGRDKNLPWQDLKNIQHKDKINFIFFGEARDLIQQKLNCVGPSFAELNSAIDYCLQNARAGESVLLSPGGTSLDEFKNFEQRGDFFKTKVRLHFADQQK